MDNRKMFMGIDGGGTKTVVFVTDEKGNAICRESGDNTNFYASGFEVARNNLLAILQRVYKQIDRKKLTAVFIGMSAIEYEADTELTNKFAHGMFDCPVFMHTDAYAALMGHTFGKSGALLISGTGSIAIALNPDGELRVFGGWGYLLGDEGSAYHIALTGLRSAVKAFDSIGEPTILCDAIMNKYQLEKPQNLLDHFGPGITRSQIAAFAKEVADCAEKGDAVARKILLDAAEELAKIGASAAKYANCNDVGVYGGILQNVPIVRDEFCRCLRSYLPDGRAIQPELPPEAGAVVAAMIRSGIKVNNQIINNLNNSLKTI